MYKMSKQVIIAFCGHKGCGKDVCANMIQKHYNNVLHLKISQKLKNIVKELFHFKDSQMERYDEKEKVDSKWGISPRQALEFIGTEMFQYKLQELVPNVKRRIWIDSLIQDIKENHYDKKIVLSDLRFMHEHTALKEQTHFKCVFVRVDRPYHVSTSNSHCSEKEFQDIPVDFVIDNSSGITYLQKQIFHIMNNN